MTLKAYCETCKEWVDEDFTITLGNENIDKEKELCLECYIKEFPDLFKNDSYFKDLKRQVRRYKIKRFKRGVKLWLENQLPNKGSLQD